MTKLLLTLHVLAAIIAVGPVTVAASMFPPSARKAMAEPGEPRAAETVRLLHRICRVYAGVGIAVPVLGFATAGSMGVLGDTWLIVSIALTTFAAGVLIALVLPRQEAIVDELGEPTEPTEPTAPTAPGRRRTVTATRRHTVQLAMFTGVFNILWATVTVLMIVRPGSTTGA
ncbi:protease [Streptomyces sp. NPDC002845]